uniref:Folate/biopterin transporter n=1 Tax=Guillardia theta TaxID=55529 RepID=A0A7S4NJG6_GUITH
MASSAEAYYEPVKGDDDEDDEYKLPEDATFTDYLVYPLRSGENFFSRFTKNFGWRFAIQMTVMYLLVKGLMLSVLGLVKLSYCKKTLKIDGSACQTMMVISSTPWAIKGSIGVLADAYPLFGYHKASYILVAAVIGSIGLFALATFPVTSAALSAILLFSVNLEIATSDLLCEGKYAELMQTKPKTGSTMVSYVWGCFQIGSLVAAMFVGPVADHYDPKVLFWVLLPLAVSIIIPTSLGYLADERVAPEKEGIDMELIKTYPYIVAFCIIMAAVALGNAAIDIFFFEEHFWQMVYAISCSVFLSVLAFLWLPRQLAKCNFYMFMASVLYLNISGAQDFWFTADEQCVPGGPAFDYTYYNTYTSIVGAFTGWVGVVIFQNFMSGWTFRTLFWVTTVLQCVASASDLIIINRLNIAWGIPDKWFYMFGDAVIGPAVMMFALMPAVVLTSKLVPKGLESTTYALLAGFQNFGGVVSNQIGLYATQFAGVKTEAPCNFDNLGWLVGISHCLLPLLAIPLTFILIPNKLMTEMIIEDEASEPTLLQGALGKDEGTSKEHDS